MSNRELLENLTRLKAERDALRSKEDEQNRQREIAKQRMRDVASSELEKRRKLKEKVKNLNILKTLKALRFLS